jgi:predicted Abi (CAAX) family protease
MIRIELDLSHFQISLFSKPRSDFSRVILKLFTTLFHRFSIAFCTRPTGSDCGYAAILLLIYAMVYLPIGFGFGFLEVEIQSAWITIIGVAIGAFFNPAIGEELVFRVFMIPHPTEEMNAVLRRFFILFSWIAFVVYHPLNPLGEPFFSSAVFLVGAGLLGIVCTLSYLRSGSLWTPVAMHWLIVVVWLLVFGGLEKFTH